MPEPRRGDPLLDRSPLPFAAPDFSRITPDLFLPAFREGIAEATREIAAIADNVEPPTFANTLEAMERAGATLAGVGRIFWTISSAQAEAAIRELEPVVSAMLTEHSVTVSHDPRLFARVRALWEQRETLGLDEAQRRLLDASHRGFVSGGANLDPAGKARYAAITRELSALSTSFGQNVLAAAAAWEMLLDADDLDGLPMARSSIASTPCAGNARP